MRLMVSFRPKPGCGVQLQDAAPAEPTHARAMREGGILRDLSVSAPGHAWLVLTGDDSGEVDRLLRDFPMHPLTPSFINE
jgi:hypothetical protein